MQDGAAAKARWDGELPAVTERLRVLFDLLTELRLLGRSAYLLSDGRGAAVLRVPLDGGRRAVDVAAMQRPGGMWSYTWTNGETRTEYGRGYGALAARALAASR